MDVSQTFIKIQEHDPEHAYQAVRGENTYLLQSIEGGMTKARYSFIGFNPSAKVTVKDGVTDYKTYDKEYEARPAGTAPLEVLKSLVEPYRMAGPSLSRFSGGYVGYLSYDSVRQHVTLSHAKDDLRQPDSEFILTRNNIIFDHKRRETYLVENHFIPPREVDVESSIRRLEETADKIRSMRPPEPGGYESSPAVSNMTEHEYVEAVKRCKEYIREGDIFQAVLSQRLSAKFKGDKYQVYSRLRDINPSPYMYYLDFGARVIAGSSPETLARVEGGSVSTYPIAGTRRRGKDAAEDAALAKELLADKKERAEHVMLVDLGRNDVGRVAEYGSVKVAKYMDIEKYSHVMHMSSEVTGRLRAGLTEFDALESIFPAGTVSGAPKVRAMEIIDELEPTRRGLYAGAVGYFSFNRSMDTAIAIRTLVFEGDDAYVQAGAGIVADSDPAREYEETMSKGKALLAALEAGR